MALLKKNITSVNSILATRKNQVLSTSTKRQLYKAKGSKIKTVSDGDFVQYLSLDGNRPIYKVLGVAESDTGISQVRVQKIEQFGVLGATKFNTDVYKVVRLWLQPGDKILYEEVQRGGTYDRYKGTVKTIYNDPGGELIISVESLNDLGILVNRLFMEINFRNMKLLVDE